MQSVGNAGEVFAYYSFDLFALWCLCRVRTKDDTDGFESKVTRRSLGLFAGVLCAVVAVGALALWMAAEPHVFRFSYTAFCFVSLLAILNVGVLRFSSVHYSASVLLLPLASAVAALAFLFAESYYKDYAWLVPEFPFWILVPIVVLIAVGKAIEAGKERKVPSQRDE